MGKKPNDNDNHTNFSLIFYRKAVVGLLSLSIILLMLTSINLFKNPGWMQFGLLLVSFTVFLAGLLCISFYNKRNIKPILWISLFVIIFLGLVTPLLIRGMSLVIGLFGLLVVFLVSKDHLSPKQVGTVLLIGLTVLVLSVFIDSFGINERQLIVKSTNVIILSVILGILDTYIVINLVFANSLRTRIIGTFMIYGISIILFLIWIELDVNKRILTSSGTQSLGNAAYQVALYLDHELESLENINNGLSKYTVIKNMFLNPSQNSELIQAREFLQKYSKAEDYIDNDYLLGYLLLDTDQNTILAVPENIQTNVKVLLDFILVSGDNQGSTISPIIFDKDGKPYIFFITEMVTDNKEPKGYFVSVFDGYVLQDKVQKMNNLVGGQSFAVLIDDIGLRLAQGLVIDNIFVVLSKQKDINFSQQQQFYRLPPSLVTDNVHNENEVEVISKIGSENPQALENFTINTVGIKKEYAGVKSMMTKKPWKVIYVQQSDYLYNPIETNVNRIFFYAALISGLLILVSISVSRDFVSPIETLIEMTKKMKLGDFSVQHPVSSHKEIRELTNQMNALSVYLKQTLNSMSEKIKHQSIDFERRTRQLQLAADVGRAAVTIHNPDNLLSSAVDIISKQFNLYHVGIYLIEESGEHAVLKAASSEGGKRMLAVNHKLAIGYQGLVGYVAASGQPEIALDVGEDAEFFNNPELPHTRSELALPLISSSELIGVLDIHSNKSSAFTPDDFNAMQVLANLIAVAVDNARLFMESRNAVEATRRAYGEISRKAWLDHLAGRNSLMIRSQSRGTYIIDNQDSVDSRYEMPQLISVPIKVRDLVIGFIDTYKPLEQGYWTEEEEDMLKVLAEQVGIALESARLYESTKALAVRERLVAEVNSRLQENLDVDLVIKVAAQIFRQALDLRDVTIVFSEDLYGSSEDQ